MVFVKRYIKDVLDGHNGATSSEYAILVALIAVVIIGALVILGAVVLRLFEFEFPMPF